MYGQPMQPMYGQPQPMYGQPQPMYAQPMQPQPMYMPPQQQGPTIIRIDNDNDDGSPCQFCGTNTGQTISKKMGCVAICWCICLLPTVVLWCIPCCGDSCKDTQLVCIKCHQVKSTISANCC